MGNLTSPDGGRAPHRRDGVVFVSVLLPLGIDCGSFFFFLWLFRKL
jgi:hypothetical protein